MILRGIHVEHWRCIRRLQLNDLPEGLIVLHGPNGTGKSSLMLALRNCLFDSDHNAAGKELLSSLPRNGNGPPKVSVEFSTGGATYRLTKVFSKRKDGTALLEKQVGSTWKTEQSAPKEASRCARELLGADKSTAGLNQLLWLTQGDIGLPDQKDLDTSLEKKLVDVLGVLVTGRDIHFQDELEKRCAGWFTPLGRLKESSLISQLEKLRSERLKGRDDEKKKFDLWDDALRRLHGCEDELPSRKHAVQQAEKEVERLKQEREQCQERKHRHGEAANAVATASRIHAQAGEELAKYRNAQQRLEDAEAKVALVQDAVERAQERHDKQVRARDDQAGLLALAQEAEEKHQQSRAEIDDCRKLVTLAEQHRQIEKVLEAVATQEKESAALEQNLKTLTAPDDKALKSLRDNRRQAEKLRAQLQAGALTLTVTLQKPVPMKLTVDGQPFSSAASVPGEPYVYSLRQRAHIALQDIGTIELARTHENLDLERTARELAHLDRDYEDSVRSFLEDPADESCLDHLLQKQIQRGIQSLRLTAVHKELDKNAPQGRGTLETTRDQLGHQQRLILERRPELTGWQPAARAIDEREQQFNKKSDELAAARKPLETAAKAALDEFRQAQTDLQTHKQNLAVAAASAESSRGELQRLGDEPTLTAKLAHARDVLAKAEQALAASALTEAEQTLDQRCAEAEAALGGRNKRLRDLQDQLIQLRGFLQGNEGLHTRLADAEAMLQETDAALARERVEADAHKRLLDLFNECRENQVEQVMGPIADRVLEWARKIGLNQYQEVRFGDQFLPEGIVMAGADPAQPIVFDNESYGTGEQLSLLVRLALGGILAKDEPMVAILDDPLAHADPTKHRNILNVLRIASEGGPTWVPPAGRLQILILTCHPDRFDHLPGATHINLDQLIER